MIDCETTNACVAYFATQTREIDASDRSETEISTGDKLVWPVSICTPYRSPSRTDARNFVVTARTRPVNCFDERGWATVRKRRLKGTVSTRKLSKNRFKIRRWLNVDSWTYRTFNRFGWTMSKFIPRFLLGASCFPTFAFIRGKFSLLGRTRLIARHFLKDPRSIWRALFPFPAIFYPFFSLSVLSSMFNTMVKRFR